MGAMPSPCVGICKMTQDGSLCVGCLRTAEEIANWPDYLPEDKLAVFRALPQRRAEEGRGAPVLGHSVATIDRMVLASLDDPKATWTVGVPGALVEFNHLDGSPVTARLWEYGGDAISANGGVRVVLDHATQKIKVIGQGAPEEAPEMVTRLDLCLYTRKAAMSGRRVLTEIGQDTEALRTGDRQGVLFDLGLALPHIDYCVRVEDPALLGLLRAQVGESVLEDGSPVLQAIEEASPHRIALTRLGRVEAWSPIPPADGATPAGPHSHLRPDLLARKQVRDPVSQVPSTMYTVMTVYPGDPVPLNG